MWKSTIHVRYERAISSDGKEGEKILKFKIIIPPQTINMFMTNMY